MIPISMNTFTPHHKEEEIVVKITKKEAVMIHKLRKHAFGKFVIHKANNVLTRIEITSSEMLEIETEVDLT